MGKYDDIINLSRPKSNRIPMNRADRAKIFMPFAALKGYDDEILQQQKQTYEKIQLSEEEKEILDKKIKSLEEYTSKKKEVKVTIKYFQKDYVRSIEEGKEVGEYMELFGSVKKIDAIFGKIKIDENVIELKNVVDISGEMFE